MGILRILPVRADFSISRHQLFPFYRCWGLGGDIVADTVHATYLINDFIGNLRHEVIRQMSPVGSHGIRRSHGTKGNGMLVSTLITHHTDTTDGTQQDGTSLPYLVIKAPLAQCPDINIISILKDTYLLGGDIPGKG